MSEHCACVFVCARACANMRACVPVDVCLCARARGQVFNWDIHLWICTHGATFLLVNESCMSLSSNAIYYALHCVHMSNMHAAGCRFIMPVL